MGKLSEVAQDLVNKIGQAATFGGRVGVTLGGTEADPTLSNLATPYAWVVLNSSRGESEDRERWTKVRYNFTVLLGLTYGEGENDFVEEQLSLIEEVCQAVTGTQVDALKPAIIKWSFDGLSFVAGEPHVIRYALNFSASIFYTQST